MQIDRVTIDIETPRLLLRRWRETDLAPFGRMNADPEVMRHFPETCDAARTQRLYDSIQREFAEYGYGLYAAEEKASGRFMGFIGFHWARFEADFCPCIEIGWRLDEPFWGKGYATEGAAACLEHGYIRHNMEAVYSLTTVGNLSSRRVMEKIGLAPYRYFDHPGIPLGHPQRPHVCYRLTRADFLAQRGEK